MGALLGMALGMGAQMVGSHMREKRQQEDEMTKVWMQHPDVVSKDSETMKIIEKRNPMMAQWLSIAGPAAEAQNKSFGEAMTGASTSTGTATGSAPSPGGKSASASGTSVVSDPIAAKQQHIQNIRAFIAQHGTTLSPQQSKIAEQVLSSEQKDLDMLQQEKFRASESAENRAQRGEFHQDAEADRASQRQMAAQSHADSMANAAVTRGLAEQTKHFTEQMALETHEATRNAHFQSARQNLAAQTQKIAGMLTSATPADPNTVKTLLNQRNAQARTLKQQAEQYGIDYTPDEFAPLTTETAKKSLLGVTYGSTTSLAEENPKSPETSTAGAAPVTKSKSGRKMVKDASAPHGWSYAE